MTETRPHKGFAAAITLVAIPAIVLSAAVSHAMDNLQWRDGERTRSAAGRIIVEAQDGGILFESQAGGLWAVQADQLVSRSSDEKPFEGLSSEEVERHVRQELGVDMQTHRTAHFTLLYDTSPEYVQWCASLYERLYGGFFNFWKTRRIPLQEPELPLVAVVFQDKRSYLEIARRELGDAADGIIGYYSLQSNRIYTYDLTGADGQSNGARGRTRAAHIQRILSRPQAIPLVATLIHEATHQLCYNSGLQNRYVDNPVWLSEGLAIYFETPDTSSGGGWRTIGRVNRGRLERFRKYLLARPADSLQQLIATDHRMRSGASALDAYAESWALCYFLIRTRSNEFGCYVQALAERPPLAEETSQQRIALFEKCMGQTIAEIDEEFLRYIARLR